MNLLNYAGFATAGTRCKECEVNSFYRIVESSSAPHHWHLALDDKFIDLLCSFRFRHCNIYETKFFLTTESMLLKVHKKRIFQIEFPHVSPKLFMSHILWVNSIIFEIYLLLKISFLIKPMSWDWNLNFMSTIASSIYRLFEIRDV